MLSKRAADVDQLPLKNLILSHFLELASLCSFLDGNSNCNSSAYHRVVTHTDQTHHFYVRRSYSYIHIRKMECTAWSVLPRRVTN